MCVDEESRRCVAELSRGKVVVREVRTWPRLFWRGLADEKFKQPAEKAGNDEK